VRQIRRSGFLSARGWIAVTCATIVFATIAAWPLAAQPTTREDFTIFATNAAKLASLRKGVTAMMALDNGVADPALNPMGWKYQAYIHGVPKSIATPDLMKLWTADEKEVWNSCQHSTWFFLAWHRMEIFYFERIMRVMSGDNTLSIPYWNFGVAAMAAIPPVGARLPPEFRVVTLPDKTPNSLYWPQRNANANIPPATPDPAKPLSGEATTTLAAFMKKAFFTNVEAEGPMSFGGGATGIPQHGILDVGTGQIENIPHNTVHGALGNGNELSLTDAGGAGLDPMFWPIHINIDRAWACWQQMNPDATPKAGAWLTETFTFFDAGGTAAKPAPVKMTMKGADVINTAKQLMYMYNNCNGLQGFVAPPAPKIETKVTSLLENGKEHRLSRPLRAAVPFDDILTDQPAVMRIPLPREMQARIQELARGGSLPEGAITLTVGGIAIDNTSVAPTYCVFLDLPENAFPDETSKYYISQLTFFGVGHHRFDDAHQDHGIAFDLTDAVEQLIASGEWRQDEVSVTFANTAALYADRVKAPPAAPQDRARFTSLRLTVR
jgi:tyrosinase